MLTEKKVKKYTSKQKVKYQALQGALVTKKQTY